MGDKGVVPESNVKRPGTGGVSIKTIPLFLAITALLLTAIVPLNSIGSEEAPSAENLPPVADAGEEITTALMNDIIVLNGSASTDEEIDNCTWEWTSTSHSITLQNGNSSMPSFTVEYEDTTIVFELKLIDPQGLNSTAEVGVIVEKNLDPRARIQLPMPSGDPYIEGTVMEFTANGTSDTETDSDLLTYDWRSNVSGPLSDQVFFHIALWDLGWHTISLNVSDPNGGWDMVEVEILIREAPMEPIAEINKLVLKKYPTKFYLKDEVMTLDGSRTTDPNIEDELNLTWRTNLSGGRVLGFGEKLNVTLEEGVHNITLTAVDLDDLTSMDWVHIEVRNRPPVAIIHGPEIVNVSEEASFRTDRSYDPDGDELEFTWYFEGGDVLSGIEVSQAWSDWGVYNVTLEADDGSELGALANETVQIIVNAPPVADAGGDRIVTVDEYFILTANMSYDEDEGPSTLSFRWDLDDDGQWDDGLTRKEERLIYEKEGEFPIRLEVSDGWASSVVDFIITAQIPNDAPVANGGPDIIVTLDDGQGEVDMDASRSYDPDDDVNGDRMIGDGERDNLSYSWDINPEKDSNGDGNLTNDKDKKGRIMRFIVRDTDVVMVTLNVSDRMGKWTTDTIMVRGNNPPEITGISVIPSSVFVLMGADISFIGNARDSDRKDELNYTWDMGDGTSKKGYKITHRYTSESTYTITLTVDDGYTEVRDSTTTLTVEEFSAPTISDPRDGAEVSGVYTIRGKAREAAELPLDGVEISLDGNPYRGVSRVKSDWTTWSYDLDTTKLTNGEHTIEIRAVIRDVGIEHTSNVTTLTIMVNNQPSSATEGMMAYVIGGLLLLVFIVAILVFLKKRNQPAPRGPMPGMPNVPPPPGSGFSGPFLPPPPSQIESLPPAPDQQDVPGEDKLPEKLRIRCPACRKVFTTEDNGERPLKLVCSHCGANGMIEGLPDEEEKGPAPQDGDLEEGAGPDEERPEPIPIVCPNCSGLFELDQVMDSALCPFCGTDGELDEGTIEMLEERFGSIEQVSIRCPRCETRFEVEESADQITCPSCGAKGKI